MTLFAGSDETGRYDFSSLPAAANYIVTPTKARLELGAAGITTIDVIAVQRHFLTLAILPPGCPSIAADVSGDGIISTVDVIAIQRFFLGISTGIARTGTYEFSPISRFYLEIANDQTDQNYDALILGDVATPFAE